MLAEKSLRKAEIEVFGNPLSPNYIPDFSCISDEKPMIQPDLMQVVSDPALHVGLELSSEQEQLLGIIKHQMVIQDQFNQLTKHVENIYGKLKTLETALANKVLS